MSEQELSVLLKIIDERVQLGIRNANLVSRVAAQVVSVDTDSSKLTVTLLSDTASEPAEMRVRNKTGESCAVGDVVYCEKQRGIITNATIRCGV